MDYMIVDLKSFYASVECAIRGLNPFTTYLCVTDIERGNGTISMAATPALKELGVPSRVRVFDIPYDVRIKTIFAKPKMKLYMEYAVKVYNCFLDFFSSEDIHVYSIDESFIYIKPYLSYYKMTPLELGNKVLDYIFDKTGLYATCGIGENMFMAKIALDVYAKKISSRIAELNYQTFYENIWPHKPITDIWSVGQRMAIRLEKHNMYCLKDIALSDPMILDKEFGVVGRELYDHSWGKETATISEVKEYAPKKSFQEGQVLLRDYDYKEALVIVIEMVEELVLKLVSHRVKTSLVGIFIGYSKDLGGFSQSKKLEIRTDSFEYIKEVIRKMYIDNVLDLPIRNIGVSATNLTPVDEGQVSIFDIDNSKERALYQTISILKKDYGKNSINKALSYLEEGNQIKRNTLVGGHNSE